MYSIYKEIILDKLLKKYDTVLTVSNIPPNLNHIIKNIRLEKVSVHPPKFNCGYAFKSFYNVNKYMTIEELPQLISFLNEYDYVIDYEANKLLTSHMNSNFVLSFYKKN
tara:strand:- start:4469 stop:4795 length:327 start_codon:yes stop_codon:yes gene_type:complete